MTPYAKLSSLDDVDTCLKPGLSCEPLDAVATAETDLEAAQRVCAEERELLQCIASLNVARRQGVHDKFVGF